MDSIVLVVALVIFAGVAIAVYEHRKKTTLLKHDFNQSTQKQTETNRELERSRQGMSEAHIRSGLHDNFHQ
jgi:hypothetical protein